MRSHTKGELETFQEAVHKYLEPLAATETLTFVQIDEELYALVAPNFYIKLYCAGGHGYSFGITIGPTFEPKWNTEDERGLSWLVRYVSEDNWSWTYIRYDNPRTYSAGIVYVVSLLPKYIAFLKKTDSSFWTEFYSFVREAIAQEMLEDKRKA